MGEIAESVAIAEGSCTAFRTPQTCGFGRFESSARHGESYLRRDPYFRVGIRKEERLTLRPQVLCDRRDGKDRMRRGITKLGVRVERQGQFKQMVSGPGHSLDAHQDHCNFEDKVPRTWISLTVRDRGISAVCRSRHARRPPALFQTTRALSPAS
jgi:hypothetical protein